MNLTLIIILGISVCLNFFLIFLFSKKQIDVKEEFFKYFQEIVEFVNNTNKENRKELSESIEKFSKIMEDKFEKLRVDNINQLEKMREIVNEKLQSTLERRIGESFKLVNTQLDLVQKGLGQMQNLARDVGDLKRVLTNVKVRGTWGEVQLEAILTEILTPEQFEKNVEIRKSSNQRVEFAVKLPGKEQGKYIYLPIDSKFPQEDYLKLLDAYEKGNREEIEKLRKDIQRAIFKFAEDINKKYIYPPITTDFAIMFLPVEGLYAEVLKIPGQVEEIQRRFRILITSPTTLSALLNSLRIGFKTLAIEKRSAEVWKLLSAVRTEFSKFAELIEKLKRQLNTISNTLEQTDKRTKIMEKKLKDVEKLPDEEVEKILG